MILNFLRKNLFFVSILSIILLLGLFLRFILFEQTGGDYLTYKRAVEDFDKGINFYTKTVESFKERGDEVEHGYSYFPTLLYIQYAFWKISNFLKITISTVYLWKIPTLISEFVILFYIVKLTFQKNKILSLFLASLWIFNPYLIARFDYNLYDPLFLMFTFLAVLNVEKSTYKSAIYYAIALSLKTIPMIIFPLFIIRLYKKNKFEIIKFLGIITLFFIIISIPFMKSFSDFNDYLNGAFFIHSERGVQGRPLLTFISYITYTLGIRFYQNEFSNIYTYAALISAIFLPLILYFRKKITSNFAWVTISFTSYLCLTPVLNRTHTLWFFTFYIFLLGTSFVNNLKKSLISGILVWMCITFYLYIWNNGFDKEFFYKENPVTSSKTNYKFIDHILRNKYYELKSKLY